MANYQIGRSIEMMDNQIRQTVYKLRNDPQKLYDLLDAWEQKIKKAKQQILRLIQKKGNQEKTEQSKITNKNKALKCHMEVIRPSGKAIEVRKQAFQHPGKCWLRAHNIGLKTFPPPSFNRSIHGRSA